MTSGASVTESAFRKGKPIYPYQEATAWLPALLAAFLLLCRYLTTTEGAVLGETLWIAQLSWGAAILLAVDLFRGRSFHWSLGWVDIAVLGLGLAHVLSTVANRSDLDGRAAANMLCEWSGLVVTWFVVRRAGATDSGRRQLVVLLLASATILSCLGLWQHYHSFAETRREVERFQREWQEYESASPATDPREAAARELTLQRLRAEMVRLGIPLEESARMQWEQRVQAAEPFGRFALANTLAGLLVCACLLWIPSIVAKLRGGTRLAPVAGMFLLLLLAAYCLLLTKSRTAYVALVAGLVLYAVSNWNSARGDRRVLKVVVLLVALVAMLAGAAVATGGLDRFVLSESGKSLRYRWEYWQGSWRMLMAEPTHLWAGVGPGNFRSHYQQFKLPESSEEIADPHNFLLDAWANSGILGLGALALVCIAGLRRLGSRPASAVTEPLPSVADESSLVAPTLFGGAAAFVAVSLAEGGFDELILVLGLGWLLAAALCERWLPANISPVAAAVSLAALLVHLLGAGGIEMPAVVQTILVLVVLCQTENREVAAKRALNIRWPSLALAGTGIAGFLVVWFWGTFPVLSARQHLELAREALFEQRRIDRGERELRAAAEADPLGFEACDWLADVALQRWQAGGSLDDELFDRALDWWQRGIARYPRHLGAYRAMGRAWMARFEVDHDAAAAASAADAFASANELYPNSSELQALLADALDKGGRSDAAKVFAEGALELDEINRRLGHIDKWLGDPTRKRLEAILRGAQESPDPNRSDEAPEERN